MARSATEFRPEEVTLAVLAGGESSRMGLPKAALVLGGRPILEWLIGRFGWPGPLLLVTAPGREHPPAWERFAREVVDPVAGRGPLRGILTALEAVGEGGVTVVTTVDMPGLAAAQFRWMIGRMNARPAAGALLLRREGRVEPFPSVFRSEMVDVVRRRLGEGRLAVHGLADEPGVEVVDAPGEWPDGTWVNLNRPEDVEAFGRVC